MADELEESPKQDAAPRKRTRTRNRAKPSVEPRVRAMLTMVGMGWKAADDVCGQAFLDQVPEVSTALAEWAKTDPRLYEWLSGLTTASGPLGVMLALSPVVQTVVGHHVIPNLQRRRAAMEGWEMEPEPAQERLDLDEVLATANAGGE